MFAESDDSMLAHFPDKRPASPSFEGYTRCDKKSRFQAAEPDVGQNFLGLFESHHLPSLAPTSDDVLCDETRMVLDEDNDTDLLLNRAEIPVPDTLPDTCFGVVSY